MDGFTYMSIVSRIERYEQIARRMAKETRKAPIEPSRRTSLTTTAKPGDPVQLPDEKSA